MRYHVSTLHSCSIRFIYSNQLENRVFQKHFVAIRVILLNKFTEKRCPRRPFGPLSTQKTDLSNVSFKIIKSRQISENDGKNLNETYISSLKRVLLLVLQLSFPKNVPHFRAILRPPAVRGQQGLLLRHCQE